MKTKIIIPARYGSSRLKGKPLIKILGREMILRVADICVKVCGLKNLYIATDSKKIAHLVKKNNYNVLITSKYCLTGTDRVAETSKKIDANIFINVQGDEPLINPIDIKKIIKAKLDNPNYVICGYCKLNKNEDPSNKNIPKIVMNSKNELIYISRSAIPGTKKKYKHNFYKQVCIYAFNKKELNYFSKQKTKSLIEYIEDIEILRFFELGIKIKMVKLNSNSVAVDEKCDIKKVEKILKNR